MWEWPWEGSRTRCVEGFIWYTEPMRESCFLNSSESGDIWWHTARLWFVQCTPSSCPNACGGCIQAWARTRLRWSNLIIRKPLSLHGAVDRQLWDRGRTSHYGVWLFSTETLNLCFFLRWDLSVYSKRFWNQLRLESADCSDALASLWQCMTPHPYLLLPFNESFRRTWESSQNQEITISHFREYPSHKHSIDFCHHN